MKKYILNDNSKQKLKDKIISMILVFLNILIPFKMIIKSYKIENLGGHYSIIFSSLFKYVFIAFFIYFLNEFIIRKTKYKLGTMLCIFLMTLIYSYRNYENVKVFITNEIVRKAPKIFNLIYNGKAIDYIEYKLVIALFIIFILVVLLYLTSKFKNLILISSFSFVTVFWYLYTKDITPYLDLYFFNFIISICLINYSRMDKKYKKENIEMNLNIRSTMIFTIIISGVMIYAISTLPKEYKAISSNIYLSKIKNKFSVNSIENAKSNALKDKYNIKSSGYSDSEKELGGPIELRSDEVFKVYTDIPYYLKGNVKYIYDGKKWSTPNEVDKLSNMKKKEKYENETLNKGNCLDDMISKNLKISYKSNLKTNTFFVPEKTVNILGDNGYIYHNEGDTYIANKNIEEQYTVAYYIPKYLKDAIKEEGYEGVYNYLQNSKMADLYKFMPRTGTTKGLIAYDEDNEVKIKGNESVLKDYKKYLQVPTNISDNIYALTNDVIEEDMTNIDKGIAIKNYLKEKYPYSINVSNVPDDEEFLSYFLFNEKKGYCTYFATATSVMCRISGIPSRYVEGFKISQHRKEGLDRYTVTNSEAHAWCEILIDPEKDIWIPLDPSPTPTELEKGNEKIEEKKEEVKLEESNTISPGINGKTMRQLDEYDDETNYYNLKHEKIFKMACIIVTIVLYIIIKILLYHKRKLKVLKSNSVIPLYNYYLYRMETLSLVKNSSTTDLEFSTEIKNAELRKKLKELIELSYEEYYGGVKINSIDKKSYIIFIENYIRKRQSILQYLMKKYLVVLN